MASGTITGSFSGGSASSHHKYRLIWSSTPEPENRRSKVKLSWYVVIDAGGYYTNKQNAPWSKTVDGTTTSGTANFNYPNPQTIAKNTNFLFRSETIYITHDADGTKTASISGTINLSGTTAGTGSLSGSMVLDQIAVTPPTADTLTYSDVGTGYSSVGAYVAGFTKFSFTATATAGDTPISSYAFYRGSSLLGTVNTSATSATLTMTTFEPSGSWVYSVVVTDTAGNSATKTLTAVSVLAYSQPTITASTFRCDSGGTADDEGTYGKINMTWTVASVGSNTATVHKCVINGSTYTSFPQTVGSLATTSVYSAVYTVTDKLGQSASITQYVQPSMVHFDLYPSAQGGAAFGKSATQAGVLETPWIIMSTKEGNGNNAAFIAQHGTANKSAGFVAKRTDVNKNIQLLVGDSGTSRGLYHNDGDGSGWVLEYNGTRVLFTTPCQFRMYGDNGTNFVRNELPQPGAITTNTTQYILTTHPSQFTAGRSNDFSSSNPYLDSVSTGSGADIVMNKYGRFCVMTITCHRAASTSANSNILKVTMASAYRPTQTVYATTCYEKNYILGTLGTDGVLTVKPLTTSLATDIRVSLTFAYLATS